MAFLALTTHTTPAYDVPMLLLGRVLKPEATKSGVDALKPRSRIALVKAGSNDCDVHDGVEVEAS